VEVLLNTPLVADYIRKGEVHLIKEVIAKSNELGMQTLDQSLVQNYKDGNISLEDAVRYADSSNDVRLMIKMFEKGKVVDSGLDLTYDEPDSGQYHRR
jgi:twitching motility protein PilU